LSPVCQQNCQPRNREREGEREGERDEERGCVGKRERGGKREGQKDRVRERASESKRESKRKKARERERISTCTDGSWAKSASRIANRCRIAAFSSLPAPANFVSTCRSMTSLLLIRKRFFGEFHRRAISALRTCSRTLLSLFGGSWRAHTSMRYFSAFSAPKSSWLRSSLSVSQR